MTRRTTIITVATLLLVVPTLLACGGAAMVEPGQTPRWACPSPTPLLFGADGPVKSVEQRPLPTTAPAGPQEYAEEPSYYEEWEREYGAEHSGPPFPTPTPYALVGTSYVFGQRVQLGAMYGQVQARAAGVQPDGRQLYLVEIGWVNQSGAALPIDYGRQVRLSAIAQRDGRVLTGRWTISDEALAAALQPAPPASIPIGASSVTLPVLAPPGAPQVVDLVLLRAASTGDTNGELRRGIDEQLVVQWTNAALSVGPPCADPGALTAWGDNGEAWGEDAVPVAPPPGAERVVQLALLQAGKAYVWGATGPDTFDCSGLTQWSYGQIGLSIPRTAQMQSDGLKPVDRGAIQPGDLVYFSPRGNRAITHAAMIVGDLDGDGAWDIVHAMSPRLGVRVTYGVFESAYYGDPATCTLCIATLRTVR